MDAGNMNDGESSAPLVANNDGWGNEHLIPQLFTSVPSLNEAASYIAETTSFITSCFPVFSEPASWDSFGQEMVTLASQVTEGSLGGNHMPSSGSFSAFSESFNASTDPPLMHDGASRSPDGESAQNANAVIQSTQTNQNGISIFQGLVERVRTTVRGSADDIGWLQCAPEMHPVEDGTERFMEIIDDIRYSELFQLYRPASA